MVGNQLIEPTSQIILRKYQQNTDWQSGSRSPNSMMNLFKVHLQFEMTMVHCNQLGESV